MNARTSALAQGGAEPVSGKTAIGRVLVLDDSRAQRKLLGAMLKRWGFEVIEARNGADALDIARAEPVDLVISDWMMPGMNGLEFCRAFRALEQDHYGYFILLSSKSEKQEVARGLDVGADDFLTKPFHADELRARIAAAERILSMQKELRQTLDHLRQAYDTLDRDLIEARKLQQSLVPHRFHDFDGTQMSLLLRPRGHVGGDLVGFFAVNEAQIGLYAIDVSGHGVSSALMTARLAGYLTGASPDQNLAMIAQDDGSYRPRSPAETASLLNNLILQEVDTELYFTLLLAHLNLHTGDVTLTQAGQPHPAVQRAEGRVEFHGDGGLPVGLVPGADYEDIHLVLAPGDRLLLYSDGVSECEDRQDRLFDQDGLADFLKLNPSVRGAALLDAMIEALQAHAGQVDFQDDVSAVLLEFSIGT